LRRHTLVIEGGQLGAALAVAIAKNAGLADTGWFIRRDGRAQVQAHAPEDDRGARNRWAAKCREVGLSVAPAPWERNASAVDKVVRAAGKGAA
jgi:hypothetical protein